MDEQVRRLAKVLVHEEHDRVCLQIELGNDQAVTLTCTRDGDPPSVALWHGSGEHSFVRTDIETGETADRFRAWLDQIGPVAEAPA
jgi:hypothetical protein